MNTPYIPGMNPMMIPTCKARTCKGEDGARDFPMGPNSSDTVIDEPDASAE